MAEPENERPPGLSREEHDSVFAALNHANFTDRIAAKALKSPGQLVTMKTKHGVFHAKYWEFERATEIFNETQTWRIVRQQNGRRHLTGNGDDIREWAMLIRLKMP